MSQTFLTSEESAIAGLQEAANVDKTKHPNLAAAAARQVMRPPVNKAQQLGNDLGLYLITSAEAAKQTWGDFYNHDHEGLEHLEAA